LSPHPAPIFDHSTIRHKGGVGADIPPPRHAGDKPASGEIDALDPGFTPG